MLYAINTAWFLKLLSHARCKHSQNTESWIHSSDCSFTGDTTQSSFAHRSCCLWQWTWTARTSMQTQGGPSRSWPGDHSPCPGTAPERNGFLQGCRWSLGPVRISPWCHLSPPWQQTPGLGILDLRLVSFYGETCQMQHITPWFFKTHKTNSMVGPVAIVTYMASPLDTGNPISRRVKHTQRDHPQWTTLEEVLTSPQGP